MKYTTSSAWNTLHQVPVVHTAVHVILYTCSSGRQVMQRARNASYTTCKLRNMHVFVVVLGYP